MTDQPKVLDTELREAIRTEVRAAVKEALSDIPTTAEVHQMIERQVATGLAGMTQIVDTKLDTYTTQTIEPILDMVKGIPGEFNELKILFAGISERINLVLTGFDDIKTTQARLDAEHEQVRDRMDSQNERLIKNERSQEELRADIFGTTNPNGPRPFAQEMRDGLNDIKLMVGNNQAALRADFIALRGEVHTHTEWIESRRKIERFVTQTGGKLVKGVGGVFKNRLLWALLLSGGGLVGFLVLLLEYLRGA